MLHHSCLVARNYEGLVESMGLVSMHSSAIGLLHTAAAHTAADADEEDDTSDDSEDHSQDLFAFFHRSALAIDATTAIIIVVIVVVISRHSIVGVIVVCLQALRLGYWLSIGEDGKECEHCCCCLHSG